LKSVKILKFTIKTFSIIQNDLKASIPGIGSSQGNASNSPTINKLRELMNQVQEIKVDRENVEKELKKIRCDMSNDFSRALAETGVVNEEKLSAEKIQQLFKPLRDRVEQSIKRQDGIMAEVEQWNKRFAEERHVAGGAEREKLLKELAASYDSFFELQANLTEGTKVNIKINFYI
jgi:programmed cell death 6-interacting protein